MYSELWSPRLRQGDIFGECLFPLVKERYLGQAPVPGVRQQADVAFQQLVLPAASRFAAIVSHDCEFNEGKRQHFLVARVEAIPGNLTDEQREELRAGNDVAARAEAGDLQVAVDGFVVDPIPGAFEDEMVVRFTTITPFPMGMRAGVGDLKRAELTQPHRELFRRKLALFFGRDADDIPADEKVPPRAADEG